MDQQGHLGRRPVFRPDIAERITTFRRVLARELPDLVDRVIVFGSQARGDADEDSDIDVAVLVRDGRYDDERVRRIIWDAVLDHAPDKLALDPLALPHDFLEPVDNHYKTEFARRIDREGVEI